MGKQHNKVLKRRRRNSYLKRKHTTARAGKAGQRPAAAAPAAVA